jgi:hypothetical protein
MRAATPPVARRGKRSPQNEFAQSPHPERFSNFPWLRAEVLAVVSAWATRGGVTDRARKISRTGLFSPDAPMLNLNDMDERRHACQTSAAKQTPKDI